MGLFFTIPLRFLLAVLLCCLQATSLNIALAHLFAARSSNSLHPVVARHLNDTFIAPLSGL